MGGGLGGGIGERTACVEQPLGQPVSSRRTQIGLEGEQLSASREVGGEGGGDDGGGGRYLRKVTPP